MSDLIGDDIRAKIKELGFLWKSSANRPNVSMNVLNSWEQLISDWAKDETMPLIIRKGSQRGREFVHSATHRVIIASDNTFALWVYRNILDGKTFSLDELKSKLLNNDIPMVYALTPAEKKVAKHTKTLSKDALSDSDTKWKLCHIHPVGLNTRKPLQEIDIDTLVAHFKWYANPKNMFILPKEIGGLGEITEFIDQQIIE